MGGTADGTAYVIAGLGNPGAEYAGTRHNIGFDIIELAAENMGAGSFRQDRDAEYARAECRGADILFIRPLTFMNASGKAVRRAVEACGAALDRILVVLDDVNLPLGRMRLRTSGSAGGHNGLASVIYELGSVAFPRLRVGVGSAEMPGSDLVPFVLGRFDDAERDGVEATVRNAAAAVAAFTQSGAVSVMNEYNNKSYLPHNT